MKSGKKLEEYVPARGDIIYIDFNPIRGHEQGNQEGRPRPALNYIDRVGMRVVQQSTASKTGYPFDFHLLRDPRAIAQEYPNGVPANLEIGREEFDRTVLTRLPSQ